VRLFCVFGLIFFVLFLQARRKLDTYQTIGDDQVSEFKEAFELFDSDRTGFITKEGLQTVLKQFGTYPIFHNCYFYFVSLDLKGK
jgi:EF-hand domain